MKKSGLADSPFFKPPVAISPPQQGEISLNQKTDVLPVNSMPEPVNERSPVQAFKRSDVQPKRKVVRQSYDFYQDQVTAIDELGIKLSKERGRHVTKGEVMRELVDEYFRLKQ